MKLDVTKVKQAAADQLRKELFDEAVAKEVIRLKTHKPWWQRLFPFEITIRRLR